MEMQERIVKWAERMGYMGRITPGIKRPCNSRSETIWCQILEKVKPKQEVEHVRRNLIVHKLKKHESRHKVSINFPIKELEVWKEKCDLEEKIKTAKAAIQKNSRNLDYIAKTNNHLYITIESTEQHIKEHEGKEYLLERRSKNVQLEIAAVQEKLDHCINLTPVEVSQMENQSIIDDLTKCAEKLKTLASAIREEDNPYNNSNMPMTPKKNSLSVLSDSLMTVSSSLIDGPLEKEIAAVKEQGPVMEVQELLCQYNRSELWHGMRNVEEYLKTDLKTFKLNYSEKRSEENKTEKDIMSKLHYLHIEKQLEAKKYDALSKKLEKKISEVEIRLMEKLASEKYTDENLNNIKMQISYMKEEAKMGAAIATFNQEYKILKDTSGVNNELQQLHVKLYEIKSSLESNMKNLVYKLSLFNRTHRMIQAIREDISFTVRKLSTFTEDFAWLAPLSSDLATNEVKAFRDFCLDYNRQFTYSCRDQEKYTRDYTTRTIPYIEDLDAETISMLASFIESPSSFPEAIMLNIIQCRKRLDTLKSLNSIPSVTTGVTYSYEELSKQESYIDYAIDKVMYLLRVENPTRTSLSEPKIRELMALWLEMPMRDAMLPTRLVDGKPYAHYEKTYDSYYKQLC